MNAIACLCYKVVLRVEPTLGVMVWANWFRSMDRANSG